jgi:tetratricopeptide (TPR) repeat protein
MASIIEGYSYDIFISYRQKDNKGDRWVSEFVEALKTELESTFKEEISVYFDINPHDGLLETHDVYGSLKEKLKCLIFIPIISRTYCDPKSFAWEHEFMAFVEQASQDQFGLKVKLPNGNVASRVLPIRIHDLDIVDIKECESVLGSVLRGIEFIYKSPGVNRPLRSKEENPHYNLNHTIYRDQINKVALALKEIVVGLMTGLSEGLEEKVQQRKTIEEIIGEEKISWHEKLSGLTRQKVLYAAMLAAILVIAAILAYPKLFKRDTLERLRSSGERISVAVMPFQNLTNDTIWNVWQDVIQVNLISSLSNSPEDLEVRQTGTITDILKSKGLTNYKSITPSIANSISRKLDANVLINGSLTLEGDDMRINAQLIDPKKETVFKSFSLEGSTDKVMPTIDSLSRMIKDYLIVTKLLKEDTYDNQKFRVKLSDPEAYKIIIEGDKAFGNSDFKRALNMYLQALTIDSTFINTYLSVSWTYLNLASWEKAKKWSLMADKKRNLMSRAEQVDADVLHAGLFGTVDERIRYLKVQKDFDDQKPMVYNDLGSAYNSLRQYDKAILEFEKGLDIYKKWGVKPYWVAFYTGLGGAYHSTGQYKKERKLFRKAEQDFPNIPSLRFNQAILALTVKDTIEADNYIQKYISLRKEGSASEGDIKIGLAGIYNRAGILDKAEEYYRQALSLEPENPERMNSLAYFLIDKEQNTNEGLELIEKALQLRPDNYIYLHCKGWGLYKQGKYQESLDILQKSWNLRREKAVYNHEAYLHLESAKKAVAGQK